MDAIDTNIIVIDSVICENINRFDDSERGLLSQNILSQLRNLVEAVSLKAYSSENSVTLTYDNIEKANAYVKAKGNLNFLAKFHHFLQIVASHYTVDPDNSERLMLKYYEYLLKIKAFLRKNYNIEILNNIDEFPIDLDANFAEYYEKIASRINALYIPSLQEKKGERCYVQKVKPFFVNHEIYYEVTLTLAQDDTSKFNRIIAFTKLDIQSCYAIKAAFSESSIDIFNKTMPIKIVTDWEVSIRPCEIEHFIGIFGKSVKVGSTAEYRNVMAFLTTSGMNLVDVIDLPDQLYRSVKTEITAVARVTHIYDVLDQCRNLSINKLAGTNVVRYLLYRLYNRIIKGQIGRWENENLSNLFLKNGSIPFDKMPFIFSPLGHNPKIYDLFGCLDAAERKHELLARLIRNNIEIKSQLYTPKAEIKGFTDIDNLIEAYNARLHPKHSDSRIEEYKGYLYILEYETNAVEIINELIKMSQNGITGYTASVDYWLNNSAYRIDSQEKSQVLRVMFASSCLAIVYGAAGTGKSTLINHISNFWAENNKLFLAVTNPAVENLRSRVTAPKCTYMTIANFLSSNNQNTVFDFLFIDECSFVSNASMVKVLRKASYKALVLVGDIYQIQSIAFGNWFGMAKSFVHKNAVYELSEPHRSDNKGLLDLWAKVRSINGDISEFIARGNYSSKLDESIFEETEDDEITLCLNYDGLYGINNINSFLQNNNSYPPVSWDMLVYKVGDPVLFNESKRFMPVIHNNLKGKIVDIEIINDVIKFDVEIHKAINVFEIGSLDLELVGTSENGNSVVRFYVNKIQGTDEDDNLSSRVVMPFQIAYAVSIHKSQGLEYDSVKVIITTEVEELITHNIFYTAITRAKNRLKIYWTPETQTKIIQSLSPIGNKRDASLLAGKYGLKQVN